MDARIGNWIQQPAGYKAFVPSPFPPKTCLKLAEESQLLHEKAAIMLGKLDGITQLLPDLDFFIF